MGLIKEPKGVDFIIQSKPLTDIERKEISEYIKSKKSNLRLLKRKKLLGSRKLRHEILPIAQHTLQAIWAFGLMENWFVFGRFGKSENRA
jgi:hypothetical protein